MSDRGCPSELELERALAGCADAELRAHLLACCTCAAAWREVSEAIALARELPVRLPSNGHCEELRTALLASPAVPRRRLRPSRVVPILFGAAAVAGIIFGLWPRGHAEAPSAAIHARRGTVHAHAGAQFALAAEPPDELVRLRDGTIDLDVQPLLDGERFRVVVGAAEVEVRGTSFEVVARGDALVAVQVVHGRVEVRRPGLAPIVLTAGQGWQATGAAPTVTAGAEGAPAPIAPAPIAPAPIAPAPIAPAPIAPAPIAPHGHRSPPPIAPPIAIAPPVETPPIPAPAPAPVRAPDPQEVAFVAGWDAMRRGDFSTAARAFARVYALTSEGPLAEDGAYWHAVAVARAGRSAEAIGAFRGFLAEFPRSNHVGAAAAMLGWMLVDTGDLEEARTRFRAAAADPSAAVQASARDGLQALEPAPR
jgi:TolA-binding protein